MRIVMVGEFFDDALDYQENFLAKYYRRLGHEVVVITSNVRSIFDYVEGRDGEVFPTGESAGTDARIIRLPFKFNFVNRIRAFGSIQPILEAERPDLIYFHDILPNLIEATAYVKRNPAVKMIMDFHADYSNSGANWPSRRILHGLIRRAILEIAKPKISMIFPIVPASADFLKDIYGLRGREMELLPLGVDVEMTQRFRTDVIRNEVRSQLGIPADAFVVFTGGKLSPLKHTEFLFDAVRRIGQPHLHVIVAGQLPAEPEYRQVIEEAAAGQPGIHFVGWQNRDGVYRNMAASDAAVFPSGQSVMWQQSLGMGLPLVVSETSPLNPHRQDVSYMNALQAITVVGQTRDLTSDIEEVLSRFVSDRGEVANLSDRAIRTAHEYLSYEKIALQTLRFC
jgi:1,2-diacylglycerol 3-alpha-glucosyltransferase